MPRSAHTLVRYMVAPARAAENEALVRDVYRELGQAKPPGLRYATFRLDDGVTFVHLATLDGALPANPLPELDTFRAFQAGIRERCAEGPTVSRADSIGSFGWYPGG